MGWSSDDLKREQEDQACSLAPIASKTKASQLNPRPDADARWRLRLGVAWISAVLIAYYLVHPPFSSGFFAMLLTPAHHVALGWQVFLRLAGHLLDLFIACFILLLGTALGQVIWRWSRLPAVDETLRVALGSGLGIGVLSLATFVLGLLGWLSSWMVGGGLIICALLCIRPGWWVLCWLGGRIRQAWQAMRVGSWLERFLWGSILFTILLLVLAALLPPTAWDALMYHLAVPAVDQERGRVLPDPANPQGYQPELVEMLYLDALFLHGDGAAAPIHAGFGLLSLLVLVALARRIGDPAHGAALALRTAALFLSMPSLVLVLGWPYIDGALVYYELAAIYALLCWWNGAGQHRIAWLILAGVLLGLGLDTKYTAAFALGALSLLVFWRAWRMECLRMALWGVAVLVGSAFLVGSPWLLRNLLMTGDPLFPYHLGQLFPAGPQWDEGRTQHATEGPGWGWTQSWRLLTVPLEVILYGKQGSVEFDATLGPLLLLLLPLGILAGGFDFSRFFRGARHSVARSLSTISEPACWPEWQVVGVLLVFAAFQMGCWDVELLSVHFARQSRLFFPLFAALALPAAAAWKRLNRAPHPLSNLYRLATVAVVLVLTFGVFGQMAGVLGNGNAPYLLGLQDRRAYLADHLDPYYAAMGAVNKLPDSAHILFLWEVRSYYASPSRQIQPDPFLDNFDYYYRHCPSTVLLSACLHRAGFTHLLFYAQGLQLVLDGRPGEVQPQQLAVLRELLESYARLLYQDNVPLIRDARGSAASDDERMPGARGWYRLYVLTSP